MRCHSVTLPGLPDHSLQVAGSDGARALGARWDRRETLSGDITSCNWSEWIWPARDSPTQVAHWRRVRSWRSAPTSWRRKHRDLTWTWHGVLLQRSRSVGAARVCVVLVVSLLTTTPRPLAQGPLRPAIASLEDPLARCKNLWDALQSWFV